MSFRLFVDSSNGVSLDVEYDYLDKKTKIENAHRTRSGNEYRYKWSDYQKFAFTVKYVNSSTRALVNSWWENNTDLLFKDENSTEVFSVHLNNKDIPINKFIKPYSDLWQGKIELGTY